MAENESIVDNNAGCFIVVAVDWGYGAIVEDWRSDYLFVSGFNGYDG